jgi:methylenetetrahydrofolate dehydrogenase (NADP+)/methenyltetrahydrofolate cyclohydrolase
MNLLDGKTASRAWRNEMAETVRGRLASGFQAPCLAAVLVGNNGASLTYVNAKVKACQEVGYTSQLIHLPEDATEAEVLQVVHNLNTDPGVDGFIVQLPLPKHISEQKVLMAIHPGKDVDGFHPENFGKMALGLPAFIPATPFGILELLKRNGVETVGKHCVVVGRSNIVGLPMSLLMVRNAYPGNSTVTTVHSKTTNLKSITQQADILVAAIGKPGFITADMVKPGVVVVDVGITRIDDPTKKSGFRLQGDVDFESVSPLCSHITPVPGGVGPMTIAGLMFNTLQASLRKKA